jgi:hypothetical protein
LTLETCDFRRWITAACGTSMVMDIALPPNK